MFKHIAIGLISVCLTGCGFHLANDPVLPKRFQTLSVTSPAPYDEFTRTLITTLQRQHIQLTTHSQNQLNITHIKFSNDTPTIGTSAIARVYRYTLDIDYQFLNTGHVSASRFTTLSAGTLTSTNNQVQLLKAALITDVIRKLLVEMKAQS